MKATQKSQPNEGSIRSNDQPDWYWADPKSLKVKPAFESLIPLQSRGEYMALEKIIQADEYQDPLLIWKDHNVVLDGHTRRELSIKYKKQVKVREVELPDEKAAVEFILRIQHERRNLTREAMSYFRGTEYNAVKQQRGGKRLGKKAKGQLDPLTSTAAVLGQRYGVSEKTVKRDATFASVIDRVVEEYGQPEIKRKLLGADVKLTYGTARVLLRMPAQERKTAIKQLIEQGDLPRVKKETKSVGKPKAVAQSLVANLQAKGQGHATAVLQHMAKLLGMEVAKKQTSQAARPQRGSRATASMRPLSPRESYELFGID